MRACAHGRLERVLEVATRPRPLARHFSRAMLALTSDVLSVSWKQLPDPDRWHGIFREQGSLLQFSALVVFFEEA